MKALTVLLIAILISLKTISQISVDSTKRITCIPNENLNAAVRLIEKGKLDAQKVELQQRIIVTKDSIINSTSSLLLNYRQTAGNYERDIRNLADQNKAKDVIIN